MTTALEKNGILSSPFPDVEIPDSDICSFMFPVFRKWGELVAMECAETGRCYTYNQLVDLSLKWCGALQQMTKGQDEPSIAVISPNILEYVIVVHGCFAAGMAIIAADNTLSADQLASQLLEMDADVIVADSELEQVVDEILGKFPRKIAAVFVGQTKGGYPNLLDIINDPNTPVGKKEKIEQSKAAAILFSSGTTGKSKGVVDSHKAVLSYVLTLNANEKLQLFLKATETQQETVLSAGPFWNSYFFYLYIVIALYAGVRVLILQNYDLETYISAAKTHKVRTLPLIATLLREIGKSPLVKKEDLLDVEEIVFTGTKCYPPILQAIKEKAPHILIRELYGTSETKSVTMNFSEEKPGSCGQLLPNYAVKVVDMETASILGPEEEGELYIRGSGIMSHYRNNPVATQRVLDKDGWYRTGDIGYFTKDGWIYIADRLKDLVKVFMKLGHPHFVSPSYIEQILMKHPCVADAAVIGVYNEETVEAPKAFVVLRAEATEEELVQFVNSQVDDHEELRGGVTFVQQVPRTHSGKILRRFLKELK